MQQKPLYKVVTSSLGPLEYRTSYTLATGGVELNSFLTTYTSLIFFSLQQLEKRNAASGEGR